MVLIDGSPNYVADSFFQLPQLPEAACLLRRYLARCGSDLPSKWRRRVVAWEGARFELLLHLEVESLKAPSVEREWLPQGQRTPPNNYLPTLGTSLNHTAWRILVGQFRSQGRTGSLTEY
jgi:hypothetical protein